MKIESQKFTSFHYTLKDDNGDVVDTSSGKDPLGYIHGVGSIVPGLEKEMEGKTTGDKFQVVVAPKDGYGERNDQLTMDIPLAQFGENKVEPGMKFQFQTDHGVQLITVLKVDGDQVNVDANHPMAGVTLHFDIEITEVRDATAEELAPFSQGCGSGCGTDCGSGCGDKGEEGEGGCGGSCH